MLQERTVTRPDAYPTLEERASAYLTWLQRTGRAASSKDKYAAHVGYFMTWLAGRPDRYAGAFEDPDVRDYAVRDHRREMIEARSAPTYVALRMAAVADFYRWLGLGRPDVPSSEALDEPKAKALTEDQLRAVLRAAARRGVRDAGIVNVLFYTAARVGELCKIRLDDFWVSPRGGEMGLIGKGEKQRTVDLNAPVRAALQAWLDERRRLHGPPRPGAPLFVTREGRPLTAEAARHAVRKTGEVAHLTGEDGRQLRLYPHVLRHTWATLYLQGGGDVRTAQQVLGHRDLRTTAKYTTASRQRRREAMESVVVEI
jgi:site-specific recombinase XerD